MGTSAQVFNKLFPVSLIPANCLNKPSDNPYPAGSREQRELPMGEQPSHKVRDVWNALSHEVAVERANLSATLFLAYRDAWERFERVAEWYVTDRRRDWTTLKLESTDTPDSHLLTFDSPRRREVAFLLEKGFEVGDALGVWAYTTTTGQMRRAAIESFVDWARGYWFPRLSYRFMDDLTPRLKETFSDHRIELTEFVVNVFERPQEDRPVKQKTTRTWVEVEGDREYDLYRRFNAEAGRVVTLNGARYNLTLPEKPEKVDVRIDHRARILLSTPHFQVLNQIQSLLASEASREFQEYSLGKRMRSGTVRSDAGEVRAFVEYAGTELLVIEVQAVSEEWFDSLKSVIYDTKEVVSRERLVPFVLVDEGNPLFQAQLVDLEGQDVYTITIQKEDKEIIIAPESLKSNAESVGKIVNFIQKTVGASSLSI